MENKPKKIKLDPLVIKDLWSEDEKTVLKAIHRLRQTGSIHYIPELLKLLEKSGRENVEKELTRFLADIKDPAISSYLVRGLKDPGLENARGNIVSACWQSGMDYSGELDLFIRLFLEGDYRTALECFTVIEESAMNLEPGDISAVRDQIIRKLDDVSNEKKPLAIELVKLLEM